IEDANPDIAAAAAALAQSDAGLARAADLLEFTYLEIANARGAIWHDTVPLGADEFELIWEGIIPEHINDNRVFHCWAASAGERGFKLWLNALGAITFDFSTDGD